MFGIRSSLWLGSLVPDSGPCRFLFDPTTPQVGLGVSEDTYPI